MQACPPLVTDALRWALDLLVADSCVRRENGIPNIQRARAKIDARNLLKELSFLRTDVHANIGFGRG